MADATTTGKIVPDICFGEEGLFIIFYLDISVIQVVQLQTAEYYIDYIEALTSREPTERLVSEYSLNSDPLTDTC